MGLALRAMVLCLFALPAWVSHPAAAATLVSDPAWAADACPPEGHTRERLQRIKAAGFLVPDDAERNALALALLACVSDPDPALRDGIVYEGLATWLRAQGLARETVDAIYANLVAQVSNTSDPAGFQQPFAALILSEVARTDRIEPWLTPERRMEFVKVAADYLRSVSDYRGFSETEGWRHGVAHASDLVLQLVLNPAVDASQIRILMDAVSNQVSPRIENGEQVFYIYGEPGRLARAVFYAYQRGVVDDAWWAQWFRAISDPGFLDDWSASFASQAGLARRHNTVAFLLAMHFNATSVADARAAALDVLVMEAISTVLGG